MTLLALVTRALDVPLAGRARTAGRRALIELLVADQRRAALVFAAFAAVAFVVVGVIPIALRWILLGRL
jgi:hypothetical protein